VKREEVKIVLLLKPADVIELIKPVFRSPRKRKCDEYKLLDWLFVDRVGLVSKTLECAVSLLKRVNMTAYECVSNTRNWKSECCISVLQLGL